MALPTTTASTVGKDGRPRQAPPEDRGRLRARARRVRVGDRDRAATADALKNDHARVWGGGRSLPEGEPSLHLCGAGSPATRDARPRQLPTDTSHAAPTRECQSDPPSLPRDARHPTLETLNANTRGTLTFCSMSGDRHGPGAQTLERVPVAVEAKPLRRGRVQIHC